ncbi:MAG: hypothetical protein OXH65_11300 [Paracoccaceae bacterium]|nr:hypothetical protein [Paracoccaceae bacterium]MDE2675683.1 hypothetical protein [Paracoccaceae bacterium]MXZ50598.1 transglutaminase family protein [Paracoccaceae bacterium]MYF45182.1 transglutaminase family protein [Paracoccaceae bacterium]MYI91317.1 transglutaminase family protein [Paracoccaceae bacterium]
MTVALPKQYSIQHDTYFDYDEAVNNKVMLVRLQPRNDRGQYLRTFSLTTEPDSNPVACVDSFGNVCHTISIFGKSTKTHIRSTSRVNTIQGIDLDALQPITWDELQNQSRRVQFWHYLAPSQLVYPGEALDDFITKHGLKPGQDPLVTLRKLCSDLYNQLEYQPGSTTVESSLEFFLERGKGVCQDYTHAMLALGRKWGIPCRYVSGYLYILSPSHTHSQEVASHAWPEFWLPEAGWIGLDPTNDSVVDHRFVRVAQGRDYADVAPTRGVIFGGGRMSISVKVTMKPVESESTTGIGHEKNQAQVHLETLPWRRKNSIKVPPDQNGSDQ